MKKASQTYQQFKSQNLSKFQTYANFLSQQQIYEANLLLSIIKKHEAEANFIEQLEKEEQETYEEELKLQQQQEEIRIKRQELEAQQRQMEKEILVKEQKDREIKHQQEEEEKRRQQKLNQEKVQKERAKKYAYRTLGQALVQKLKDFRKTLEPFDKDKNQSVKKRRLLMKKVARGKLNTLSHDKNKIDVVVNEVVEALKQAKREDDLIKEEFNRGTAGFSREMALGYKYLVDLICSTFIVRIQAEGFSG